jgi:hypothetical protein
MRVVLIGFVLMFAMASVAVASEYPPGETYGQISPDRVMAERMADEGTELSEVAMYMPEGRFGYYQVTEQYCPERVLCERGKCAQSEEYLAYSNDRYPMWECCEQVSPDRVFCERCGQI